MHGKKFIISLITTYFRLVTLITVATLVLGLYFDPNACFGYTVFAAPLFYGACGVLPSVVMYSKRELTVKALLVRKLIQFVLIEVLILSVAFHNTGIQGEYLDVAIGMGISIFLIYVLAHMIDWLQNYMSAKRMTEELINFQKNAK